MTQPHPPRPEGRDLTRDMPRDRSPGQNEAAARKSARPSGPTSGCYSGPDRVVVRSVHLPLRHMLKYYDNPAISANMAERNGLNPDQMVPFRHPNVFNIPTPRRWSAPYHYFGGWQYPVQCDCRKRCDRFMNNSVVNGCAICVLQKALQEARLFQHVANVSAGQSTLENFEQETEN